MERHSHDSAWRFRSIRLLNNSRSIRSTSVEIISSSQIQLLRTTCGLAAWDWASVLTKWSKVPNGKRSFQAGITRIGNYLLAKVLASLAVHTYAARDFQSTGTICRSRAFNCDSIARVVFASCVVPLTSARDLIQSSLTSLPKS